MASFSTFIGLPAAAEEWLKKHNAQENTFEQQLDLDHNGQNERIIEGLRGESIVLRSWVVDANLEAFEMVQFRGESALLPDMFEQIKTYIQIRMYNDDDSDQYETDSIRW